MGGVDLTTRAMAAANELAGEGTEGFRDNQTQFPEGDC